MFIIMEIIDKKVFTPTLQYPKEAINDRTLEKTNHCVDLFRMKAITLLNNEHINSLDVTITQIRKASIKTSMDKKLVSMHLTVPLPKETIVVTGSFHHDHISNLMIPDNFQLIRLPLN